MKKHCPNSPRTAAFTMIEVLAAVALIAVLAGGALFMISNSVEAAKERKLAKDVVTLNAALSTFLANGGSLDGASSEAEVIERIKTRAEDDQADQLVGLRSGLLDPRITPVVQSDTEASSSKPRVYFHKSKQRFVLAHSGPIGVKEFVLDEQRADDPEVEHERKITVAYSKKGQDKWVWEYGDHATAANSGPSNLPPGGGNPTLPGPFVDPTAVQLDPPEVSVPGDNYPLTDYEGLEVTLTNPNPPGVSEMFYSVIPGVWERYGGPIPIAPGVNLEAQATTIDPDAWSNSETTLDEYRTGPVQLDIAAAFSQSDYDYVSLGGSLVPGSYPPPPTAAPGEVTLENEAEIPDRFENSSTFEIRWTMDGSDPLTSSTAITGDPFSDGFPGQAVPFGIDDWGAGNTLPIKIAAKSLDTNILTDSEVIENPLGRVQLQLAAPLLSVDTFAGEIDLALDSSGGQMPTGARIYFTQDGSDPGVAGDGEPLAGTLYSGTPIKPASSVTVTARTYAPVAYMEWFLPSEAADESITVLGSDELYVGGEFSAGSGMRNIARLAPDGSLDSGFNPGAGASAGSVVGAISAQGGAGVLAGGNFDSMNGVARLGIVRLLFDGSVDTGFNADLN